MLHRPEFVSTHLSFYLATFPLFLRRMSRLSFAAAKAQIATRYLRLFVILLQLFLAPIAGSNAPLVEHLRQGPFESRCCCSVWV